MTNAQDEYPQEEDPGGLDIRASVTSPFETLSERLTFPEEEATLVAIGELYHSQVRLYGCLAVWGSTNRPLSAQ
jgi:hypothetical protein